MVSKNNLKNKMEQTAARTPHYGIRKLSVGVASVLISTTLYMGATTAKADTLPSTATDAATTKPETASSSSSTQDNSTADKTAKTTVPTTASSTDTSVSTTSNAQASTTNTAAGATFSDKSSANNNSLVTNNVESTTNMTAQTQPKPDVVTSDKANVDNQVGSNVENKATTTTDTISAPTTPKRVVRSLAAAPTANSKELVENQDYTVSNVSLEDHKKQDDFDQDATFLHADINAKDGDAIANKEITVTFNKKEFGEFWNFKNQDLIYNDQVIGNLVGDAWGKKFKIAFNDKTKGFKDINLSLKVYLSDNPYTMRDLYTNNQAKNNEKYTVRHNYQIGSTNYYVDREATIHYVAEAQPTTQTTEQFGKPISYWYAPQEWIQLDLTYYTTRDGKTYAQMSNIPGKEISYDLGLGKGFITPDTKSVTISFEPSSKYYSKDANKLKISDNATFSEQTVTYQTKYDKNDLVAGFTDVYTTRPKDVNEVSDKHTYYVKDLIKLDGNTLIATDATTSTGLNNLSSRGGPGNNGYVGSNDANYTVVSSDDLRKFVIDNAAKIIETRGEFLTSNSDYSNPGRIVAHNNTTGQDVYYELHNKVRVNNRNVTTPPDGTILISAGKDIPTKVYSYTSTDIPSNVDKSKLTKEITRTINVHNPNGTVDTTVQTVTYHQTVTVAGDEVIYNNDWNTPYSFWDAFNVPQIENYKASQDTVGGAWINGVTTQNETVDITYTMTRQIVNGSWTFKYTDKMTGDEIMPSTTIHAQFIRDIDSAAHKYGDWSYVPNSFSQTGTHINFEGNPQKLDNFDNGNFDNFTFNIGLPAAPNSNYNQAYGNFTVTFQLRNNSDQPDTMEKTSSVPYDKVSVKQESQTRTLTEHYVYADGDKKGQKIANDAVVEIFYSREVKSINDQVVSTSEWKLDTTKGDKATPGYHVVSGTWTNLPTTWSVVSVSAPTIQGYTTDTNETENNPGHVSSLRWVYPTQSGELNDTFMPGNKHTYEYQPEHTTYYHANNQSIKINYVDDEKGGATVKSDTLNGKTDETVKTGITIPENYSVVGTTPSEYTFKSNGNTDITVHLKHVIDTTSEEKTITRTIKVTDPTGKVTTIPQTTKVTRTVSTDKVTNQKTYGDWTTSSFDSYDVPTIEGYTATQSTVDEVKVTSDTQNSEVNISYTANTEKEIVNGSWTFKYTDKETGEEIMPATTIHAQFTRTNTPATNTFGDWSYVKGSFSQTGTHVDVKDPTKENDVTDHSDIIDTFKFSVPMPEDPSDKYQQIYETSDVTFKLYNDNRQAPTLDKTLIIPYKHKIISKETTVEIPLNYEFQILLPDATQLIVAPTKDHLNGKRLDNVAYTVKQTIEGEAPYDKVTGTFDYTEFSIYESRRLIIPGRTLPQNIDNYYIVKAIGETTKSNQYVGLTVQELLTKLQAHNYFALPTWKEYLPLTSDDTYLDFVTKEEQGVTKAVAYNDLPIHSSKVIFNPSLSTELLAEDDDPFAVFYYTITKEETKTVTRTIELQLPMKLTQTIKQTAILTRDQYQATNEPLITSEGQWSSKHTTAWHDSEWSAYTVPTVDGYTASQNEILVTKVTDKTKDQTIRVTYTANPQSIKINYVDSDNNGSVVKSDTLSGKTDQTVKTGITIPDGYVVEGNVPNDYTFKAKDNANITVKLKHGTTIVTPDNPKTTNDKLPDNPSKNYPSGVGQNDLNKTVTRTIKATDPQGKVTTETQTVHLTRTATVDEVTGNVTYTDWSTGSFDGYDVPTIEGYTASQSTVDEAKVTNDTQNSEVNISYTANPQSIKVNYIDSDNNDSVVKSDTLSGKTDQTVKTGITIPDGYVVEGNVPTDYTFKASENPDITVKLKHGTTTVTPDKPKTTGDKLPDNPNKNYPSGVGQNDLNRTVTRTIKIADPQGKVTTTTQTVHLTRTATVDEVTGEVTYSDWSTGSFDSYDVPVIEGYTATQSKVDTAKVTSNTQNSEVNISYTANPQSIKINYVDDDKGETTVKSDTLNGKTDETVKTGITIPDGYVVEGNVPTDYTFKASENPDITVKLKHGTITVTPDNPKTVADKLPDNPNKNYPSGVAENDLNKDVTRTIKVTDPTGKVTTTTQTVHLTRTATVDEVTGKVTYGDWTTGSFDSYDVPSVEGYTASQDKVDTATVTSDTQDSEVNITYTANPQSIQINYVDDDKGGATVKSETLDGKTDQTVKTGITIPENYTVVGTTPSDYTFKAEDNVDITVHLKHVIDTKPEKKTITRTIKVTSPKGGVMTIPQSAKSTRTVSTDKVTGEVTYSDWSKATLEGYDVPEIEGYTASQPNVDQTTVDGNVPDSEVNITYTANKQVISIDYVDNGKVISTQVLTGKTDETVETNIQSPDKDKYVVVGTNPDTYTFKAKDNEDVRVEVKHVINDSTESKDVTRTIVVTSPDGKETTKVQKATVSRTVHTDAVTGAKTYDEWSKATLDKYNVPTVDGYTPSLNVVEGLEVDGNNEDSVVKVGYTANPQSIKVNYVDEDNGSSTVKTETLNGKTDQAVKTGIEIPDGYVVEGQVPTDYTFKAKDNADITVKLKHGTTTVTPDKTKTTNDKLPDNPTKSYPSGVAENDLNKDVTRTIKVTDPKGKVTTKTQTVHLTRTATVDEVTGKVTYGDWSTGAFGNYDVPVIEGYTPNVATISAQTVTDETKPTTITVNYAPNEHTTQLQYVDDKGSVIKTVPLHGVTGETVSVPTNLPAGWVLTPTTKVPETITMTANGHSKVVATVQHGKVTVTPDQPKTTADTLPDNPTKNYPSGVGVNDLNQTLTRTITIKAPGQAPQTITQPAHLMRSATVDEVTGEVTYSDWSTDEWPAVTVPSVPGYTPNIANISAQTVTDETKPTTITVNYAPNEHTTQLQYVNEKGAVIKTVPLHGVTGETVTVPKNLPAGWILTPTTKLPETITMTTNGHPAVIVTVQHGKVTVIPDKPKTTADPLPDNPYNHYPTGVGENDLNQTLTRTINFTVPGQKTRTITQTVTVHRSATVDEVTGEVTYSDWSTAEWPAVTVPNIPGYTPSTQTIPAQTVTDKIKNTTVTVNYTADEHTTQLQYVDEQGNVVETLTLQGRTGETVSVPTSLPAGWVLTSTTKVPATITMTANGHPKVVATVKHGKVTVIPDKPKTTEDTLPDNPNSHYPTGVGENDLNKTLTRTINLTVPGQKARTITQTVTVHRSATVDEVTGEVTYDTWSTAEWPEVNVPSVQGYTPNQEKVPAEVAQADRGDQTVTIAYHKDSVSNKSEKQTSAVKPKTVEPTKPTTAQTTKVEKTASAAKPETASPTKPETGTLPQTGDAKNAATWLGVINMLFTGLVGWWTKKKHKPQA